MKKENERLQRDLKEAQKEAKKWQQEAVKNL
jgi:hypothetical protein